MSRLLHQQLWISWFSAVSPIAARAERREEGVTENHNRFELVQLPNHFHFYFTLWVSIPSVHPPKNLLYKPDFAFLYEIHTISLRLWLPLSSCLCFCLRSSLFHSPPNISQGRSSALPISHKSHWEPSQQKQHVSLQWPQCLHHPSLLIKHDIII